MSQRKNLSGIGGVQSASTGSGVARIYLAWHCDTTASAGRNTRWTRMYSIGTGSREFWMHLWRMFSKKEFEGKGVVS